MARTSLFQAATSVVAASAVLLAGCSAKQQGTPRSAAAPSSASALPPAKTITPKDAADKKPLRLKFGQPVTYQRDGVSITIVPRSMEKMQSTPEGLSGSILDCGAWWRVVETWVVDIKPDTAWRSWRRDFQGVFGLFSESQDKQYGFYNEVATSAVSSEPTDLDKALGNANRAWDRKTPLHFEQSGPQYLAGCKINTGTDDPANSGQFAPDSRPLVGLELILPSSDGQNPRTWPTLAIWTP
ncbi:MAG: hypothetical protein ACRC20_17475 [Segniliparus sp.]|uniref:hypothetical protein n=1 Tax=Segniliparus sp. TaxID=2804064 RepID=UPI003F3CED80